MEPEWAATFEPNSEGVRLGRSGHAAIGAIFIAIGQQPKDVREAEIAHGFDRLDQDAL
jgi:RNA-directed DNA polymerase